MLPMPLTNAEKQARWRERNVIVLTRDAVDIAEAMIDLDREPDELRDIVKKLRKVASYLNDHVRHPERTPYQQAIALGRAGVGSLNGDLPKLAAIAAVEKPEPDTSFRVEAVGKGGRWRNGVTLGSEEEAKVYVESYARFNVPGFRSGEIMPSGGAPNCSITRKRKGGRATLEFRHGECVLKTWKRVT
jgi:hypothetical protein